MWPSLPSGVCFPLSASLAAPFCRHKIWKTSYLFEPPRVEGAMLRLSAIFSSRRKMLILGNVIQIVFLLFNHVEGIWCRPRLFISPNVNEREAGRGREREKERRETLCAWMEIWKKTVGAFGSCQPVLHANILFSVRHHSREQHLISSLLSQLKCGHALSRPLTTLPYEVLPD